VQNKEENFVIVFSSCDKGLFGLAKTVLNDNEIEFFVRNEMLDSVYGSLPVEILVEEKYEEKAKLALQDLAY